MFVILKGGLRATQVELEVMLNSANAFQKEIFQNVIDELTTNTTAFLSGAAGTGKSYLLRMLERHYKIQGFKVRKKSQSVVLSIIGGTK